MPIIPQRRIVDELRLIRLALIDLNGKADMLFSVLASIRNEQLERRTKTRRRKTAWSRAGGA